MGVMVAVGASVGVVVGLSVGSTVWVGGGVGVGTGANVAVDEDSAHDIAIMVRIKVTGNTDLNSPPFGAV